MTDDERLNIYYGIPPSELAPDDDMTEDEAQALFDEYATNGVVDWPRFFADQGLTE